MNAKKKYGKGITAASKHLIRGEIKDLMQVKYFIRSYLLPISRNFVFQA